MNSDVANRIKLVPGPITKILPKKERRRVEKAWMDVFAKDSSGVDTESFKWHVFAARTFEALQFDEAVEAYQKHEAPEYYLMDNETGTVYVTKNRPESCELFDYYIFPKNLAWTMAFTHEDGLCGPYFARHPKYEKLNFENEKKLRPIKRKLEEIEKARKKGWM